MRHLFFFLIGLLLLFGCNSSDSEPSINYAALPAKGPNGHFQMVVEIPAGTNKKREYDYDSNTFPIDQKNGQDRIIQFVGYPGNYGFIPGTLMDEARGGDGDALDVLVLAESQPTGTVMEVIPIGTLQLEDGGELDYKIIAVPVDERLRVIPATTLAEFSNNFSAAKRQVRLWFLNYKGKNVMKFQGWQDEQEALAEIEKWTVQ